MCRFSAPSFALLLISTAHWSSDAFVLPISRSINANDANSCVTINNIHTIGERIRPSVNGGRIITYRESKDNDKDDKDSDVDETPTDEADETIPIDLFSGDISDKEEPSMISQISLGIFKVFSYCIQFLGAFFGVGLILNLLGYGYTFDLKKGLVVDTMQNIRNEVQFEREIEREEREDYLRNNGGGASGSATSQYIIAPNVPEEKDVLSIGD